MTAIFVFASPLWLYSKTFFAEPYITTIIILIYYLTLKNKNLWLQGILVGLGIIIKNQFIFLALLIVLVKLFEKKFKKIIIFSIPLVALLIFYFGLNYHQFGQITTIQKFGFANPVINLFHLFFGEEKGLFLKSPFLLFAIPGFFIAYKKISRRGVYLFVLLFGYLTPVMLFQDSINEYAYGPRLIVPIIPLFLTPMIYVYEEIKTNNSFLITLFWFSVFVSLAISLYSVFSPPSLVWLKTAILPM